MKVVILFIFLGQQLYHCQNKSISKTRDAFQFMPRRATTFIILLGPTCSVLEIQLRPPP